LLGTLVIRQWTADNENK